MRPPFLSSARSSLLSSSRSSLLSSARSSLLVATRCSTLLHAAPRCMRSIHTARRLPAFAPPLRRARNLSSPPSSSVDDALRSALSRVAGQIARADPQAERVGAESGKALSPAAASAGEDGEIPGVRTAGPKMVLRFTCTHGACGEDPEAPKTTTRLISKASYESGIVVARCGHCDSQHLIADRLGWFGERTDIEEILAARGEEVQRMNRDDDEGEMLHIE